MFGRLVGGMSVLNAMETAKCDKKDRPLETMKIRKTMIFDNPFDAPDVEEQAQIDAKKKADDETRMVRQHSTQVSGLVRIAFPNLPNP